MVLICILGALATGVYLMQQNIKSSERDMPSSQTLVASADTPYTDLDGEPFTFDAFKGQVRVVNVWASWCPFCVSELADFETLATEYQDKGVAVIAINRKEPKEKAQAFLDSVGTFTATHFAVDQTDAFYTSVGGFSMPETVFYDAAGNIVLHKRGVMTLEEMREHTQSALQAGTQ